MTAINAIHSLVAGREGFGFGNDPEPLEYVRAYRDEMVADGWSITPTYGSEPADVSATLKRDGFICLLLARDKGSDEDRPERLKGLKRYETKISMWGPDGLAIRPPSPYSFEACLASTRSCSACQAKDVDTVRVGFAGRVCKTCLPTERARIERPGWDN